jgi:hypothetical protein
MRINSKEATKKYLEFLFYLKEKIENENVNSLQKELRTYGVTTRFSGFLLNKNIVIKRNGFYYWNEKIPVSINLVHQFRKDVRKDFIEKQTSISFDKKETKKPTLPKVNKKKIEKFKPVKTQQKIGVIRKFLRWLW